MQNFFMDNCQDSFGCMSEILGENFNFNKRAREVRFFEFLFNFNDLQTLVWTLLDLRFLNLRLKYGKIKMLL